MSAPALANPIAISPARTPPPPITTAVLPFNENISVDMEITICTKILGMRTALVFIPMLLTAMVSAAPTAVSLRPAANMYSKATIDTDVVSQAIYGTRLEILLGSSPALEARQSAWERVVAAFRRDPSVSPSGH